MSSTASPVLSAVPAPLKKVDTLDKRKKSVDGELLPACACMHAPSGSLMSLCS